MLKCRILRRPCAMTKKQFTRVATALNPPQIPGYGPFRDDQAGLLNFSVYLGGSPTRVLCRQPPGQRPDLFGDLRPTAARPETPAPVQPKTRGMPADDGLGLHDDQDAGPTGPEAAEGGPEEPVPRVQDWPRPFAFEHRDLLSEVRKGRFREDLYYRLRVIEIEIPPLRERPEDILPLARHFVERLSRKLKLPKLRLDASALNLLLAYPWPGNVRELENALERAAVLSLDGVIMAEDLPPSVARGRPENRADGRIEGRPYTAAAVYRTLADVEEEHIEAVLKAVGGNRTRAAEILGISPATLWRKLKEKKETE